MDNFFLDIFYEQLSLSPTLYLSASNPVVIHFKWDLNKQDDFHLHQATFITLFDIFFIDIFIKQK